MIRITLIIVCASFISGCLGFTIFYEEDKKYTQTSFTLGDRAYLSQYRDRNSPALTKSLIFDRWGRPDEIKHKNATEYWRYSDGLMWQGIMLYAVLVPIPLVLPTGSKDIVFEFANDTLQSATIEETEDYDVRCAVLGWEKSGGLVCWIGHHVLKLIGW